EHGEKLREQLLKEVQALDKDYREIAPSSLGYPSESKRALEDARSELENLQGALKAQDFELAAEAAQRARQSSHQLKQPGDYQLQKDLYLGAPQDMQKQSRELAHRLDEDTRKAQNIERQLSQLFPPSGQMMSEPDRQALKGMSQAQRELSRKAQGLRKR